MTPQENPPRDENGEIIVEENVEKYSNPEAIDIYVAKLRQKSEERKEKQSESFSRISDAQSIEDLTRQATEAARLTQNQEHFPTQEEVGVPAALEDTHNVPAQEYVVGQDQPRPSGIRRLALGLTAMLGLGLGAQATAGEKNPSDSSGKNTAKERFTKSGNSAEVSDKLRQDWNDFQQWMEDQGLAGNPALDKNDLGGAMIDKYKALHPETSISRETIDDVQAEFAKYREWAIGEIKAGRMQLKEGVTLDNFMKRLSIVDGIAGQFTTQHKFPAAYLQSIESTTVDYNTMANKSVHTKDQDIGGITGITKQDTKVVKVEKQGFAKIKKVDTGSDDTGIAKNR